MHGLSRRNGPDGVERSPWPLPARPPTRKEIASHTVGVLHAGGKHKADLLLVDVGDGPMVVKDFGSKPWWVRPFGRLQIAREHAAYRWLGRTPGIPVFIGRVDAYALAIEKVEGEHLVKAVREGGDGRRLVEGLANVLVRLHETGLVHLDLRRRNNVLVRPGGGVVVVDLAGAFIFRPGGLAHRLLFPLFRIPDRAACLKWKELLTPETMTPQEKAFVRRFRLVRRLWLFRPEGSSRRKGARRTSGKRGERGRHES